MRSRIDRLKYGSLRCVAHTAIATTSCVALNCVGTCISLFPSRFPVLSALPTGILYSTMPRSVAFPLLPLFVCRPLTHGFVLGRQFRQKQSIVQCHVDVCVHVHAHTHTHIFIHVNVCTCVSACMHACAHAFMCVHACVHCQFTFSICNASDWGCLPGVPARCSQASRKQCSCVTHTHFGQFEWWS